MNPVVVAKFGGSVIGVDGVDIPEIIQRIKSLSKDAKVIAVFSAPSNYHRRKAQVINRCCVGAWKPSRTGKHV